MPRTQTGACLGLRPGLSRVHRQALTTALTMSCLWTHMCSTRGRLCMHANPTARVALPVCTRTTTIRRLTNGAASPTVRRLRARSGWALRGSRSAVLAPVLLRVRSGDPHATAAAPRTGQLVLRAAEAGDYLSAAMTGHAGLGLGRACPVIVRLGAVVGLCHRRDSSARVPSTQSDRQSASALGLCPSLAWFMRIRFGRPEMEARERALD